MMIDMKKYILKNTNLYKEQFITLFKMVEIEMKSNLTTTGKASVEFGVKGVTGKETPEEIETAIEMAEAVFRRVKDKALNHYGDLNNKLR